MKRLSAIVLIFALIMSLAACSNTQAGPGTENPGVTEPIGSQIPEADAVITGKITQLYDGSLLLAGSEPGLYMISTALDVYDASGQPGDVSVLKTGQIIEIGFSGAVMESYPLQLGGPVYIRINEQSDDLVGFYKSILADLWRVDEGLNSDISVLAFDLSKVTNLTDSEKSALVYVVSGEYGVEGISGTFDELAEQGYIDKENLYFETGLLFEFELNEVTDDSFVFDVTKWRSGLGAYIFIDCKAVKEDNVWSYSVGSEAIS